MEIDHVDHVKRFGYYSKDVKRISEQKDHLLRNWGGMCWHRFLKKKQVKKG
jgi:hypothetical protein